MMASRERPVRGTNPPGASPRMMDVAPALMILSALLVSLLLFALTFELFRQYLYDDTHDAVRILAFQLPGLLIALMFAREATRTRELCFSLRTCAWIPLLHLVLLIGVQVIWTYVSRESSDQQLWGLEMAERFPAWEIIVVAAGVLGAALLWSASRKAERRILPWLRPLVIFLVALLFGLGLWLPIACQRYVAIDSLQLLAARTLVLRADFVWLVLLPPTFLAATISILSGRRLVQRIASHRAVRALALCGLAVVWVASIIARAGASTAEALAYANFIPVMLCAAALCMLCIATMGLAHWQTLRQVQELSRRSAPWRQEGTITESPETGPPARVWYLGWLRGFQMETSSFVLSTSAGDIPIPPGSQLIAPVPLWTTTAALGSSRAILRRGDRVTASGFIASKGEQAYRHSTAPIVGSAGIVVVKNPDEPWDTWREITLTTWRPTLLYLAAGAIVGVPGLAGFFAW